MQHANDRNMAGISTAPDVTPEVVAAAIQRGRRERSLAFWAMLEAVFSRPAVHEVDRADVLCDRTSPVAR
jgi:hypothetical protein